MLEAGCGVSMRFLEEEVRGLVVKRWCCWWEGWREAVVVVLVGRTRRFWRRVECLRMVVVMGNDMVCKYQLLCFLFLWLEYTEMQFDVRENPEIFFVSK